MRLGLRGSSSDRQAIRHQMRRDVLRMGRDWGIAGATLYAGHKLSGISAMKPAQQAMERFTSRLGPTVGGAVARWGPATLAAKAVSLGVGAHTARATYKENRALAKKVHVSRNTVTAFRAANPFVPTSLYVRHAYKKAHPG